MLLGASAAGLSATVPAPATQRRRGKGGRAPFLWGSAGAAYQIEGGNVASDIWVLEHLKPSLFKEPSGDAVDSYNRYAEDIAMAASFVFNEHRFSIEWSRIEPERGQISEAGIAYYRRMLETIRRHGMTPVVTYMHFTVPRWFAAMGGFTKRENIQPFVDYCRLITERLGDLFDVAATMNEPNLIGQLAWSPAYSRYRAAFDAGNMAAAKATASPDWASPVLSDWKITQPIMIETHNRAVEAIHVASRGRVKAGVTLALSDDRDPRGGPGGAERKREQYAYPWIDAAGDFIGVQNYTYYEVGPEADLPPPEGAELTQSGYPLAPESLGNVVRMVSRRTRKPIYVTEHGTGIENDARRIYLIDNALKGLFAAMREGADVRGYIHWCLLDNYEWFAGYTPKFGLVAVDRKNFRRTPKPSARHFGAIARKGLPSDLR
jgi:beta-glucosidase